MTVVFLLGKINYCVQQTAGETVFLKISHFHKKTNQEQSTRKQNFQHCTLCTRRYNKHDMIPQNQACKQYTNLRFASQFIVQLFKTSKLTIAPQHKHVCIIQINQNLPMCVCVCARVCVFLCVSSVCVI
jgi:hypothetical protein